MARNKTLDLAQYFVREIIDRHWTPADYGGTHMAHAKKLLKMYSLEDIKGCLKAVKETPERFNLPKGFRPQYLTSLLKFEPPLIEQFLKVPDPPPIYQIRTYDKWVLEYGKKAIEQGVWDGVYPCADEPYRLTAQEIAQAMEGK